METVKGVFASCYLMWHHQGGGWICEHRWNPLVDTDGYDKDANRMGDDVDVMRMRVWAAQAERWG